MSTTKAGCLFSLWKNSFISDLRERRGAAEKALKGCKPGGSYGAQIAKMVDLYDCAIAAAVAHREPTTDAGGEG